MGTACIHVEEMIDDIVWAGQHVAQCALEANGNVEVLVRGMTWEETVAASGFLGGGYSCSTFP